MISIPRVADSWVFRSLLLLGFAMLVLAGCSRRSSHPLPLNQLQVTFIDVGQGDSALIQTPSGKSMLVDAGPPDGSGAICSLLDSEGISRLDYLVLTHPDSDHIGGAEEIIQRYTVAEVLTNGSAYDTEIAFRLNSQLRQKGMPVRTVTAGQTLDLDDKTHLNFWNPGRPQAQTDNENSIVFRLTYGNRSFLFTGDIEGAGLRNCMSHAVPTDVLKISHHGSSKGTTQQMLELLHPAITVISVGADNRYGHPHREVRAMLKSLGSDNYRTDENGNITLRTDGTKLSVKTQYKR